MREQAHFQVIGDEDEDWACSFLLITPDPALPPLLMDEVASDEESMDRFGCPTTLGWKLPA
jgi:hypothetical protein